MSKPDLLESWSDLNNRHYGLMTLNEDEVFNLLEREVKGKARESYIIRIHQRYNILRCKRELEKFLKSN